jgi:phosphoribosyl 1,2-cyclic phosphodiesterase
VRFASLGSGSEGNGLVVEAPASDRHPRPWRLLVDCGFGVREAERRLKRAGIEPASLDAILVTHEHGDHLGGVFALARRYGVAVWATHGTLRSVMASRFAEVAVHVCSSHATFTVGSIVVHPFPVPHDAREPTQFVFDDGRHRLGLLTDTGRSTAHIVDSLSGCHGLVMECNHDRAMLEASDYPYPLKRRISGDYGHLSNDVATEIVSRIDRSRLTHVVAAHLSKSNNTPALAQAALATATGWAPDRIEVADQDSGCAWQDLAAPIVVG